MYCAHGSMARSCARIAPFPFFEKPLDVTHDVTIDSVDILIVESLRILQYILNQGYRCTRIITKNVNKSKYCSTHKYAL